ncbi:tetratricopeptide repeat protein [Nocardia tengchongensis]|uniref:tetratricopeptide repeat protein n=1 Tax=Nocardia tengchongensis TaxID=2055889 RepID=UPI00368F5DD5
MALARAGRYDEALIDVEEALRICRRAPLVRRIVTEVQFAAALSLRAHVLRRSGGNGRRWMTHGMHWSCVEGACPSLRIGTAPFC